MQTISDSLLYSATVFNTGSSGGGGSSKAEYRFSDDTSLVSFPRNPITPTSSNLFSFSRLNDFFAYDRECGIYVRSDDLENACKLLDGNIETATQNISCAFKFKEPVALKKIGIMTEASHYNIYATNYEDALRNGLDYGSWDEVAGKWLLNNMTSHETFDIVDIDNDTEYKYYYFQYGDTWNKFWDLSMIVLTGATEMVLKSANMTPSFKCYPEDYMQVITQDWHNGSEIIPSQTLTFKPYEDGGCLVNYTDDGQATNLKMFLLNPTGETITKETDFVQPVLASNGTIGGNAFAVEADSAIDSVRPAWKAFDGNTVINDVSYDQWHSSSGQPHWIKFYNPNPLSVSKVTIFNGAGNVMPLDWQFQYSDDNNDWHTLTSGTNTELTQNGEWSFDVTNSGSHKYYRFYNTSSSGADTSYVGLTEIQITGKEITSVTYDKPIYVLSPDNSFELEGYNSKVKVADLNIPNRIGV